MHKTYVHPLPVRLWHWINAVGFLLLILTGVHIRYVGVFDLMSFRTAVTLHNWIGFVVIADYFVWLVFYLTSDKIVNYVPDLNARRLFTKAFRQVRYYGYGMFVGEKDPHTVTPYDKFNPMQAMLYSVVMLVVAPIQFYTGILLWDVQRFSAQVEFFGRRAHRRYDPRAHLRLLHRLHLHARLSGCPRPPVDGPLQGDVHWLGRRALRRTRAAV